MKTVQRKCTKESYAVQPIRNVFQQPRMVLPILLHLRTLILCAPEPFNIRASMHTCESIIDLLLGWCSFVRKLFHFCKLQIDITLGAQYHPAALSKFTHTRMAARIPCIHLARYQSIISAIASVSCIGTLLLRAAHALLSR